MMGNTDSTGAEAPAKRARAARIVYYCVLASFLIPVVYLIYRLAAYGEMDIAGDAVRTQADYVLMLIQCLLGVVILHLPTFLNRRFRIEIPVVLQVLYTGFLFCAIFLGEVQSFYYRVPHWDDLLHGSSSLMTGMLGCMLVAVLNRSLRAQVNLSPAFIALFAFCFSITIGTVWEIYEFTIDGVMGLNMQKYLLESGEALVGRPALMDTMKDIIVNTCGAFIASLTGYFSMKHKKGWIHDYISGDMG